MSLNELLDGLHEQIRREGPRLLAEAREHELAKALPKRERLFEINNWWGLGVLTGVTGQSPDRAGLRWQCGKRAAQDQYGHGIAAGRALHASSSTSSGGD